MRSFGILLVIPFLLWGGFRIYKGITFDIDCDGHLKRAADANTVELASQELKTALTYLEQKNMMSGYTSIFYRTPDEDVGFWYTNLKASLRELESMKPDTTQLERSNMLIKLRETLLDHRNNGESVTGPYGISIFPNNSLYAFWGIIGFISVIFGGILLFEEYL